MNAFALWIYKCNAKPYAVQPALGGNWCDFFSEPSQPTQWGGTYITENNMSLKNIRNGMQPGDFVLAWQTDQRAAVGLCRLIALRQDGGPDDLKIIMEPVGQMFSRPVKILEMKKTNPALANVKAFQKGLAGTIYATDEHEADLLLATCGIDPKILD